MNDKEIQISNENLQRLGAMANNFETPDQIIGVLLDKVDALEGRKASAKIKSGTKATIIEKSGRVIHPHGKPKKPELIFAPYTEKQFIKKLIKHKKAEVRINFDNGTHTIKPWNARNFSSTSDLRGNLFSNQLKGWKTGNYESIELIIIEG